MILFKVIMSVLAIWTFVSILAALVWAGYNEMKRREIIRRHRE